MSTFYTLGSLILGLLAWAIPVLAIQQSRKKQVGLGFLPASFACCLLSVVLQIFELKHRVQLQDWSAIMDTIGTLSWVVVVLCVIAVVLNLIALNLCKTDEPA